MRQSEEVLKEIREVRKDIKELRKKVAKVKKKRSKYAFNVNNKRHQFHLRSYF